MIVLGLAPVGLAPRATAQNVTLDAADDGDTFRNDMLFSVPNRTTPGYETNLLATAPEAEQFVARPRVTLNVAAPAYFNSNAESASSGGTATLEGSPLVRLTGSGQLFDTPLRLSVSTAVEFDRFVQSNGADLDKLRPSARLQYVTPENDQAYSPFIAFTPRLDFDPTFARQFATRYDLNVGVSKAFNFDGSFRRLPPSGSSAAAADWSFGVTALVQRRFRSPAPASYAIAVIPSVSHVISGQWSAALGIDLEQRWFQSDGGTSPQEFLVEPIGVVDYAVPDRLFGSERTARLFGRPALDLEVGYERVWANVSGFSFDRWVAGLVIRSGWRF